MIPFHKSIGFRILGISIILLAIPLLVDSFIFLESHFQVASTQAKSRLLQEVDFLSLPIEDIRRDNEEVFGLLIYFLKLQEAFPQKETPELDDLLQELSLVNPYSGLLIARYDDQGQFQTVGTNLQDFKEKNVTGLFEALKPFEKKEASTGMMLDPVTDKPYIIAVKPIYNEKGAGVGVIAAIYDVKGVFAALGTPRASPYQVELAILLPSTVVFTATDPHLRFNYFHTLTPNDTTYLEEIAPKTGSLVAKSPLKIIQDPTGPFITFSWDQKRQIGVIQPIAGTDIMLLAYASQKDILSGPIHDFFRIYGTYFIVLILGLIAAFLMTRRLEKPISELGTVMKAIESGDLEKRYKHDRLGFEINQLGDTFNAMVEALIEKQLQAQEERVKKESLTKELKLGQSVQRRLLPLSTPAYEGVEIAHAFEPAILVGGDFFDLFVKKNHKLVLSVADASGKGVHACLYSLMLKNMLRIMAESHEDIGEAMRYANNLFCEDTGDTGMFVTVFMSQYDHRTRNFEYSSCGHNPIMIYRAAEGTVEFLASKEMAMGVFVREEKSLSQNMQLAPGDIAVLYTDGVTEAHNERNELFGEDRLKRYIQIEAQQSAKRLADGLMEELKLFTGGAKQHDDITLVVLKVMP